MTLAQFVDVVRILRGLTFEEFEHALAKFKATDSDGLPLKAKLHWPGFHHNPAFWVQHAAGLPNAAEAVWDLVRSYSEPQAQAMPEPSPQPPLEAAEFDD